MKRLILMACTILFMQLLLIFSMNVSASEPLFECHTDPKLMQEATDALVQKKLTQLNRDLVNGNDVTLYSYRPGTAYTKISPSTGAVRPLIIPITFPEHPISQERYALFQETFFGMSEDYRQVFGLFGTGARKLSSRELFDISSNGKLDFNGDIMPLYEVANLPAFYNNSTEFPKLVSEILNYYQKEGIIENYSKYDSDNNGEIDCLVLVYPYFKDLTYGVNGFWQDHIVSAYNVHIENDSTDISKMIVCSYLPNKLSNAGEAEVLVHEYGHLMGLSDNYNFGSSVVGKCTLYGLIDIMGNSDSYFNPYYRYLLDWIEPKVLPYKDGLSEIELCAYENADDNETERAVVFIPDSAALPFTEFYMAEYRTKAAVLNDFSNTRYSGVILWHANGRIDNQSGTFVNSLNYIKPVYKQGGDLVNADGDENEISFNASKDLYITGDEFSDATTPSSKFYDDVYTGAYMQVLSMDEDKATILAGFKEPDLTPAPILTIQNAEKKCIRPGERATWYYDYSDYDEITLNILYDVTVNTTGTVTCLTALNRIKQYIQADNFKGEGTIQLEIKPGTARKGGKYANGAVSDIVYVDNTPPEIALNGESEITIEQGVPYVELGAVVTDNLDPEIEDKLKITGVVNTNQPGTYYVYYNATDHAGNIAEQAVRTVTVLEAPPPPEDRIEFTKITSKIYLAKLIFETVAPPPAEEIQMYFVCKNDGVLQYSELLELNEKMITAFYIPPQYEDCDIELYVWDRNLRPLMPVQRLGREIFE